MKKGIDKLKQKWEEDPVQVLFAAALVMSAAARLINARSAAQGRRAYARQVDYRISGRGRR